MVRHEAAEAAGAVGCPGAWQLVEEHLADATREVSETCQLAVQRMAWYEKKQAEEEEEKRTQEAGQQQQHKAAAEEGGESEKAVVIKRYLSVDPAPPAAPGTPTERLVASLLDESAETPIFDRYRALFSLRDAGGAQAVSALCAALRGSTSALLKHEVAYVLGQMQDPASLGPCRSACSTRESTRWSDTRPPRRSGPWAPRPPRPRWRRGPPTRIPLWRSRAWWLWMCWRTRGAGLSSTRP